MRPGGVAVACLAAMLLAGGSAPAHGHHPGHGSSFWLGGSFSQGYSSFHSGWSPYTVGPPMVVTGLSAYSTQPFVAGFAGAGGFAGGGPVMGGPMVGGQVGDGANGGQRLAAAGPADFQPRGGKPRPTNADAKARAGKSIQHGDSLFLKQKYNSALQRYREAATTAPDLAETYFRQVFALVGSNQYESAKKALDRGLRILPTWPDKNFELTTLYGAGGHLARLSHRESLASAIEQNPQSADLLLLMGMLLYSDGERERSQLFFDRAIELGANADHLFDRFIAPRPADGAQAANGAKL